MDFQSIALPTELSSHRKCSACIPSFSSPCQYIPAILSLMKQPCPFCDLATERIIASDGSCIAFLDGFPVSNGHTLIIPTRHVASFRDLTPEETAAAHRLCGRPLSVTPRSHDGSNPPARPGRVRRRRHRKTQHSSRTRRRCGRRPMWRDHDRGPPSDKSHSLLDRTESPNRPYHLVHTPKGRIAIRLHLSRWSLHQWNSPS